MILRLIPVGMGSLQLKLVALACVALLPSLVVIGFTQNQILKSRRIEVFDQASRSAQLAAAELERVIAGVEAVLITVSNAPVVTWSDFRVCSEYTQSLVAELPSLISIIVLDAQGSLRCSSAPSSEGQDFSDRAYLHEAMATDGLVIGEFTMARISRQNGLPVARALKRKDGVRTGVIAAGVKLDWLGTQLQERGLPKDGSITVADRNGTIIARQPFPERFVGMKIPDAFMPLVGASEAGVTEVTSQDGTQRVLGYIPSMLPPRGLYVSAGLSTEASYGPVLRATWLGLILAAIASVGSLTAAWAVGSLFFVQPLRSAITVLRQWQSGDRAARTHFSPKDGEIGELGAELDRMMDEIAASQSQRALLAGELQHRVKNTLATVLAIAAATLNKSVAGKDLLPEYLRRVSSLARTHEVLTAEHWQGADLGELIRNVVDPLVPDHQARVLTDGPSLYLAAREALGMTMVVHELCTNALKHGALSSSEGSILVQWTAEREPVGLVCRMVWREEGGPRVSRPDNHRGFGSRLMSRAFGAAGSVELDFPESGLICRIVLPVPETMS